MTIHVEHGLDTIKVYDELAGQEVEVHEVDEDEVAALAAMAFDVDVD